MKQASMWLKFVGISFGVVTVIAMVLMPAIPRLMWVYARSYLAGDKGRQVREALTVASAAAAATADEALQ